MGRFDEYVEGSLHCL